MAREENYVDRLIEVRVTAAKTLEGHVSNLRASNRQSERLLTATSSRNDLRFDSRRSSRA